MGRTDSRAARVFWGGRLVWPLFILPALLCLGRLSAEDWPQWRGPSGNGISGEPGLPTRWGPNENVGWKAALGGLGVSSPVVWGDRVFVTSQAGRLPVQAGEQPQLARDDSALAGRENPIGGKSVKQGQGADEVFLLVEAFRRSDGRRLWEYRTRATGEIPPLHEKHNLATPTPATDGRRVYAWYGNGQLVALDMDGRLAWSRHLGEEYAPVRKPWGHGSSPVLYRDLILLLCDQTQGSYLLALDQATGKERWKVDRGSDRISHSTPLIVRAETGDEVIVNSSARIDAYDPTNGTLLWHAGTQRQTPIPTPVFHDGVIYLSRGYRNSDFMAIRPGLRGDVSATGVIWRSPAGASYVPSILYYQGLLYMTNEIGIVMCADAATGERIWRERLGGIFFGSPVAGDGKIYLVSETGETFVLRAGREPQVLARNDIGERLIASPAISHGSLFLRSDGALFCIGK
jgi:outer membrane protein assembly factor BamB